MRNYFFIGLFFITLAGAAQVLLPTPETAFEPQHHFNPLVIRSKGIKKITFEIIDKKDFEVAIDKSLVETYEFSEEGKLVRYYYTTIAKSIERQVTRQNRKGRAVSYTSTDFIYDTISTNYFYAGDQLILKRYHDGLSYYESRYYRYDSAGHLTKELRYKETNNSPTRSLFMLGNQVLLSEDSFQYHTYSSGQQKTVFLRNKNWKGIFRLNASTIDQHAELDVESVADACFNMSKTNTGALIIVGRRSDLKFFISTGDIVDSGLTSRMLENIFYKNSPLHDGAVIIIDNRIIAARCVLPVTEKENFPAHYGMRHRAAVGITENTDALAITVSEQTGAVSLTIHGDIKPDLNRDKLVYLLEKNMKQLN